MYIKEGVCSTKTTRKMHRDSSYDLYNFSKLKASNSFEFKSALPFLWLVRSNHAIRLAVSPSKITGSDRFFKLFMIFMMTYDRMIMYGILDFLPHFLQKNKRSRYN